MGPCWDPWPHTRVFQCREMGRMLAEISKDFTWTKRFLGVGETRVQASCGPNFIGVKCYSFTLCWSTRA